MPRKKTVTLYTIADQLGVTIQTVSKALHGKSGMSEETRSAIIQTAIRLGYRTQEELHNLAISQIAAYPLSSRRFVFAVSEPVMNFHHQLLRGLNDRFSEFGHTVELRTLPATGSAAALDAWFEATGIAYADGLFIGPRLLPAELEERLLALPLPRILLNYPPPGAQTDSVIWDVYDATYQAVRYLLRQGHRRIMYIGDTRYQRGFILRWQAFAEAMHEAGIETDPAMHSLKKRADDPDWLAHTMANIERYGYTAVICGISEEAPAVVAAIRQTGKRIPEDLSVIAFLNEATGELAEWTRPLLPIWDTGYRAADRMLWRIANPHLPYEHIRIHARFAEGRTVHPLHTR
ncbi:MAG: hypothetical protein K0Q59_2531 [Paenibacillus sp.]|nr:hypothetical protein [Paenibacillus sp.]